MGLRFRKSVKIAPGLKLNFNKKSVGITAGTKGAHYTVNSKGKRTASVGIPGSGVSYTSSSGGGKTARSNSSNKSGGGCLSVLLGMSLALVIIAFIITYAWIPGIIAIIYFAKKVSDPKQRKIGIGISAVITAFSFIFFLSSLFQPDLTSVTVNWEKQEFDINEETILNIVIEEEGADIYSFKISDNDIARVDYIDDVATVHFIAEGTADISFIADNEIQSNSTTITVIDKEAEAQRLLEAQEEQEQTKQEEVVETKEPVAQEPEEQEIMVYVTNTGTKYHRANCRHVDESKIEIALSSAIKNYEPCGTCKPPTQ